MKELTNALIALQAEVKDLRRGDDTGSLAADFFLFFGGVGMVAFDVFFFGFCLSRLFLKLGFWLSLVCFFWSEKFFFSMVVA